ncbi:S-methyl-5-thioribose-1-phosphate isomerase [Actinotignum sanguinis]|uniref:S-methyl-5-thioribose-1-phosphate isomerase n=1 Tax=Actinotignum sanguinis TaxID=1445614 RepID=UPI00293461B7|nr:S-methyl-5-thioribose-1-phosphate isomerase [Actinotignum sanguinis]MDV2436868.1 S-methyl-5-thioribose-1-phosphate isomerase [Actinotignum sanguinis]
MRTIDWIDGHIELIDQTKLPGELVVRKVSDLDELIDDIKRLAVRGAPALGVSGGLGVALVAQQGLSGSDLEDAADRLANARPTAVNLSWGVKRVMQYASKGKDRILEEALKIRDEDIASCYSMGQYGADLMEELLGEGQHSVMTVCNTGGLACVERGTALGVIQTMFERGTLKEALPVETRPLLQGSRLTAWELQQMGAPYRLIVDSAGPFLLRWGFAQAFFAGADRIAANGDTANKIGTYSLSLGAKAMNLPVIIVAPESTIDMATKTGADIKIEDRGSEEVANFHGVRTAPEGTEAINPAFDVTPHENITAIVTDRRVIRIDRGETLATVPLGPIRTK